MCRAARLLRILKKTSPPPDRFRAPAFFAHTQAEKARAETPSSKGSGDLHQNSTCWSIGCFFLSRQPYYLMGMVPGWIQALTGRHSLQLSNHLLPATSGTVGLGRR